MKVKSWLVVEMAVLGEYSEVMSIRTARDDYHITAEPRDPADLI